MTESNQDEAAIDAENRLMRDLQDDEEIPAWYYNNDVYTVIRDDDQALVVRDTGLHELNELEREYPDTDVRGLMQRLADKYAPETDWVQSDPVVIEYDIDRNENEPPYTAIQELIVNWNDVTELAIKNLNRPSGSNTRHVLRVSPPFNAVETAEPATERTDGRYPDDATAPFTFSPMDLIEPGTVRTPPTYDQVRRETEAAVSDPDEPFDELVDEAWEVAQEVWAADVRDCRRDELIIPEPVGHTISITWG